MDNPAEIKKKLREIVGADPNHPISGTVTAVDGQSCSVKLSSGFVVSDVRLNATVNEDDDYLLLTPALESTVLMLSGDGTLRDLYVIKIDKVAKFEFSQNGLKVEFDSTDKKVKIENDSVSLKDLFTDLANIITNLKVNVLAPNAPSGSITPDVLTLVNQFSTSVNSLLK